MTSENIPIINAPNVNDLKQEAIIEYDNIRGKICNTNTIVEIFYYMRKLDQYKISPLLYFSCVIQAIPKPEYIREFQLDNKMSNPLVTIPISIINIIEGTILNYANQYNAIEPINIRFDPFDIEWQSIYEYETFMNFFETYEMNDIRYDHYITILWNC